LLFSAFDFVEKKQKKHQQPIIILLLFLMTFPEVKLRYCHCIRVSGHLPEKWRHFVFPKTF